MRRRVLAVLCALLSSGPVQADGLLSDIPRAQFVPNLPLGTIERIPDGAGHPTTKTVDGSPSDWDVPAVKPARLGGTTTIQAGQLVYEDWIQDDSGAAPAYVVARRDRNQPVEDALGWSRYQSADSALGEELIGDVDALGLFDDPPLYYEKGVERYGEAGYRAGTSGSADLLELRVAADASTVFFLVRLNAMLPGDNPVAAIAIDNQAADSPGDWGLGAGVATPGADHVVTITRGAVLVDGVVNAQARVASNDQGAGSPDNPGGFGGLLEASVPRASIGGESRWRIWAGTGVWDPAAGTWLAPTTDPRSEPQASPPRVMNLAFRGGREPLRPWMEEAQAFELRRNFASLTRFSAEVDLDHLARGPHERWRVRPGWYVRTFDSRVTDGGRRNASPEIPEAGSISARQPYGLYVPPSYDPSRPSPVTMWLHWRGPGDHAAPYYVPNMAWELAHGRGNVLVAPRGRGSSGWYVGDSQIDVLDALADAEAFLRTDPDRVYVAGYSMGGWGAYLLSMLYPDRFAGAFSIVGPPALGAWPYPAAPIMPQNGRPLYFTNPLVGNARHVPTVIFHGTDDELVPVSGTTAQAQTYQANRQPYRYYLFPGYEHFSFAVVDEWTRGAQYLGGAARPVDPARVSYSRLPCLDPVHWSSVYAEVADSAYWVSGIEVREAPSGPACTSRQTPFADLNRTGVVDVVSLALPRFSDAGLPVAEVGGPPDHTTPYVMTGYEPRPRAAAPLENAFEATLTNVSTLHLDAARAGLRGDIPLRATVTTDGPVTIHLDGLGVSIPLAAGTHTIVLP